MVKYCLKNEKWSWIDHEAKGIHSDLIAEDSKKRAADKADVKAKKDAKKISNKTIIKGLPRIWKRPL